LELLSRGILGGQTHAAREVLEAQVIFVSEGHSGQGEKATPDTAARISRFTKDGKFIRSFGKWGTGPVEFRTPHDIA